MKKHLSALETLTEHRFKNLKWLEQALTHASAHQKGSGQDKKQRKHFIDDTVRSSDTSPSLNDYAHYERLEFLGDRVLGLLISEMLCALFPEASEGELSVRLNSLVNAQSCAEIAIEAGLPKMIILGADMRQLEERRLYNIYADVVEALIAVLYLEGGLDASRPFIKKFWEKRAKSFDAGQRDAKTALQEWAHQQSKAAPAYRLIKRRGPDHAPLFKIEVSVSGYSPAIGQGPSKRIAERSAAQAFLTRENVVRS